MVEYAGLTAAMALLVSSLSGVLGSTLPGNNVRASALVTSVATAHRLPGAKARAVYAHAPLKKPGLRFLYTVGWLSSAANLATCKAAELLGPDPLVVARQEIQATPKVLAGLKAAHVSVNEAALALARGATDGCG